MHLHHQRKTVCIFIFLGDGGSRFVFIYYHKLLGANVSFRPNDLFSIKFVNFLLLKRGDVLSLKARYGGQKGMIALFLSDSTLFDIASL